MNTQENECFLCFYCVCCYEMGCKPIDLESLHYKNIGRDTASHTTTEWKNSFQILLEIAGSVAFIVLDNLLGSASLEQSATTASALGPHVDDVVGHLDDIEIVLDDDDGVALVDKALQYAHQHADILKVESCGGLIQYV